MKGMKCHCGKIAKYEENLIFNNNPISGWKCSCGEIFFNPEEAEKILLFNKLRKQKFNLKLSKVKSNLILRIPKEVGDVLNLHKGEQVELNLKNKNQIVINI